MVTSIVRARFLSSSQASAALVLSKRKKRVDGITEALLLRLLVDLGLLRRRVKIRCQKLLQTLVDLVATEHSLRLTWLRKNVGLFSLMVIKHILG
jgi:hypothetical protein